MRREYVRIYPKFVILIAVLALLTALSIPVLAYGSVHAVPVRILGTGSDLTIEGLNAFHYHSDQKAWFNLSNEVNVTVNNTGDTAAGAFNVSLYANDEFIAKQSVSGLPNGNTTTLQFLWTPIGCDCDDGCSPEDYTLKAVADCENSVAESNESNNGSTTVERVYWTGYMNDEPLESIIHGTIRGGLYYTTGDGRYSMLYVPGNTAETHYDITLPEGADVAFARLNVYYTWQKGTSKYPEMNVSITNSSGTYVLPLDASYNDSPCTGLAFTYPFGNYVYDMTPCITGSGSYTVVVENNGTMPPPSSNFCLAAPGIVILYEDSTKPEYEYWLIEGADLLEGGRRGGAGSLSLEECTNNATFTGNIDTVGLETATLGMVSAWGGAAWGDWTSYYWFNNNYLGDGAIMGGYGSLYDRTVDGISMFVGNSSDAQVGANVSDVTAYIAGSGNTVSFGDDGDSMMPTNAFLMMEYSSGIFDTGEQENPYPSISGIHNGSIILNHTMVVNKIFTYSCPGTGGHSEYVDFYNTTTGEEIANGTWNGYSEDWHNITFKEPFVLQAGTSYNYTQKTGSYPQIIHTSEYNATGGKITCTKFTDANGEEYYNGIAAIRLF
ncbi:Serine protease, subtilase family [Candidatus Methanophagaceae archaeon]|nr:Serine protease, subtilase family [Methanophagales archaeon]